MQVLQSLPLPLHPKSTLYTIVQLTLLSRNMFFFFCKTTRSYKHGEAKQGSPVLNWCIILCTNLMVPNNTANKLLKDIEQSLIHLCENLNTQTVQLLCSNPIPISKSFFLQAAAEPHLKQFTF